MSGPTAYPRYYDGPIARFVDSHLQESINTAIAGLQDGEKGAIVAGLDSKGEARLAVVARLGDSWSAVGVLEHLPSGGNSAQLGLRKSWK